jgi:Zn-dependent protease with chaperone function
MARSAAERLPASALDTLSAHVLLTLDRTLLAPSELTHDRQLRLLQRFAQLRFPDLPDERVALLFRRSEAFGANAFALPSGLVVVTDDLVELAASDEELLAVLAHETGHVAGRHGLRNMIQSSVVSILVTWYIGDISALAAAAPAALLEARYSRDLEREADAYAAAALGVNGLSPTLLADILERMSAESGDLPDALAYLSTHPTSAERIAQLRQPHR